MKIQIFHNAETEETHQFMCHRRFDENTKSNDICLITLNHPLDPSDMDPIGLGCSRETKNRIFIGMDAMADFDDTIFNQYKLQIKVSTTLPINELYCSNLIH